MESFEEFVSKHKRSAAYHEAGHITAAIVQAMPINPRGMFVDLRGHGVANYFCREPGDLATAPLDSKERKLTIIALFAGHVAQRRYLPGVDETGWRDDRIRIEKLLAEMNLSEQGLAELRQDLWGRATKLADKFWPNIEETAEALLIQPCIEMPAEEQKAGWGTGQVRNLTGEQVSQIFGKHEIPVNLIKGNIRDYDSTKDVMYYDSLA